MIYARIHTQLVSIDKCNMVKHELTIQYNIEQLSKMKWTMIHTMYPWQIQ